MAGKAKGKAKATQPKTKRRVKGQATVSAATDDTALEAVRPGVKTNPGSIRQTILSGLTAGNTVEEISQVLKEKFPGSAAAEKSGKHIAFYKAKLKKEQRTVSA